MGIENGFVVDGHEHARKAIRDLIFQAYADRLRTANWYTRWRLRREIEREVERQLKQKAPPTALYFAK